MLTLRITSPSGLERIDAAFEEIISTHGPAVYLVNHADLETFRGQPKHFLDRGSKHPRRDLASYFLRNKHDRIAVLRAPYASPGQVKRSLAAFFRRLQRHGTGPVCVLSLPATVFSQLLEESEERSGRVRSVHASYADVFGYDPREQELASRVHGTSPLMVEVRLKVLRAAGGMFPVLITGPTGSGKSHIARILHNSDPGRSASGASFQEINCAAIPGELLESELFGHQKGAFTSAIQDKQGLWEVAGRGTIFLDEIGDLRPDHQAKILHALQNSRIRRLGATREMEVHARVVAASNRPLELLLRDGVFREDLYYRLSGFNIDLPALDSHSEDIPLLANHFWKSIAANSPPLPDAVLAYLRSVRWPGNVRMLRRCLEVIHGVLSPGSSPNVYQIEHVLRAFAPRLPSGESEDSDRAATHYLSDCTIHLQRLNAVTGRLRRSLELGGPMPSSRRKADGADFDSALGELGSLLRSPLLFHSHELAQKTRLLVASLVELRAGDSAPQDTVSRDAALRDRASRDAVKRRLRRVELLANRELDEAIRELADS